MHDHSVHKINYILIAVAYDMTCSDFFPPLIHSQWLFGVLVNMGVEGKDMVAY